MNIAFWAVLVLHIIACLFLIGVVLLQQGRSQDLASAFGGGGTQTAFGPRGSANVLSRATTILAALFMVTSLALSMLRPHQSSILDRVNGPRVTPSPSPLGRGPAASIPVAPGGGTTGGTSAPAAAGSSAPAGAAPAAPATTPASPAH